MTAYEFDLVISGLDLDADEDALAAFEAEIDDVTFGVSGRTVTAAVERVAPSFAEAIHSAIVDIESLPGVQVDRVAADAHVSQAEMAVRLGRSRQSVSQLVNGTRGPGGFPEPTFRSGRTALWHWSAVATWFADAGITAGEDHHRSAVIEAANALLMSRRAVARLAPEEQAALRRAVA